MNTQFHIASTMVAAALSGESLHWVQLLPAGKFDARGHKGKFDTGSKIDLDRIKAASLDYAGPNKLVVDYDHQSDFGSIEGVGGRAPAAGWIEQLEVREDGLWGQVKWTEAAATAIRSDEYRHLSPVFEHDKNGQVSRLLRAGLTNSPALDLSRVAASTNSQTEEDIPMDKILQALLLDDSANEAAGVEQATFMVGIFNAVKKALGIKGESSLEEFETAIAAAGKSGEQLTAIAKAAGLDGKEGDELTTAIASAVAGKDGEPDPAKYVPFSVFKELNDKFNTFHASQEADAAETAVASAIKDGRLSPAQKDWATDLCKSDRGAFDKFIASAPQLTKSQITTPAKEANGGVTLDETDQAVMSQLGLDEDTFVASRKSEQA